MPTSVNGFVVGIAIGLLVAWILVVFDGLAEGLVRRIEVDARP